MVNVHNKEIQLIKGETAMNGFVYGVVGGIISFVLWLVLQNVFPESKTETIGAIAIGTIIISSAMYTCTGILVEALRKK